MPNSHMISARCIRAATSDYESLKTPAAREPRSLGTGAVPWALRILGCWGLMRPVLGPSERIFRSSARKRLDLTLPGPTNSPGAGRPIPVHREHLEVWLARTGGDAVLCTASQSGEQLEFLVCSIGRRRLRPLRILFTKRRHRVTCQKVHSILRQSAARRPCQRTMAAKERLFGRRADRFTLSEFALLSLLLGVAGEESIRRHRVGNC